MCWVAPPIATSTAADTAHMPQHYSISIFEMLKIGIGPSSSHTLGPWRAVQRFVRELPERSDFTHIQIELFGSLGLTGKGHGTDIAVQLALLGHDPQTLDVESIGALTQALAVSGEIRLTDGTKVRFQPQKDIVFRGDRALPGHANALRCVAQCANDETIAKVYFSIGGGFVLGEHESPSASSGPKLPYPCSSAADLLAHCQRDDLSIAQMVRANERAWRDDADIDQILKQLWQVMLEGMHRGCYRQGELPGGLHVVRRAAGMNEKLLSGLDQATQQAARHSPQAWLQALRSSHADFSNTLRGISTFALAVNEENASFGRVVTAPTNGAAGVIPAVLMHLLCAHEHADDAQVIADFLMVAGEIGTHFKKGATISAAAGGCQAEIGVSSAMAAAALTEALGGSVEQTLSAAEIAMEHHLGMTCDPVGGLVQIPCIERNAMGAVKAVNAAQLALSRDPDQALVSLDQVISTLAETARDMHSKYKETSQGGLAVNIAVNYPEC